MNIKEILNDFGKSLISKVRDGAYEDLLITIDGGFKSESTKKLSKDLSLFSPEQLEIVKKIVLSSIDDTLHHFLWKIEQSDKFDIVAKEQNETFSLKEESDGLCGELYTQEGWIEQFSKYPATQI